MAGFTVGADQVGCRAWVNFNGGGTVAIRDDYNISSVGDNGVGDYSAYIDVDMATTTYAAIAGGRWDDVRAGTYYGYQYVGECRMQYTNTSGAAIDSDSCTLVIFGN